MMRFDHNFVGKTLVFRVENLLLDAHGADKFKREMLIALNEGEFKNIIIDLDTVKMVDSSGLGALLFARRQVVQKGGECYLVKPAPKVINLIKISKLQDAFQISGRVKEALESAGESLEPAEPAPEDEEPEESGEEPETPVEETAEPVEEPEETAETPEGDEAINEQEEKDEEKKTE
ncbi:MAG TPA: STAS domain-containing protein [bacterium]|nr:STAS domain-containing protein [bacterium]